MTIDWKGVYPAVTTQFGPDEALDLDATARHADALIRAGVHGLVMLGTVGENGSLEPAEKRDVLRAALEAADGRVPVIAGVAESLTRTACRFAADCEGLGVHGLMVLPPMIYRSDDRETMAHFRAVAAASGLPIMAYNNPLAYGADITPEMFAALADEPHLEAIKESSDDPRRITDLVNATGDRYVLLCGVDDLVLESAMLGAVGWVAGLVNAFPAESVRLWELAAAGSYEEARAIYRWFMPVLHLDTGAKLVHAIKLAQAECGLGTETVRRPRMTLAGEERERVLAVVRKAIETRPTL